MSAAARVLGQGHVRGATQRTGLAAERGELVRILRHRSRARLAHHRRRRPLGLLRGCNLAAIPLPGERAELTRARCSEVAWSHAQPAAQRQGGRLSLLARGGAHDAVFCSDEAARTGVDKVGQPERAAESVVWPLDIG